jgi:hypothetical protein
VWFSLLLSSLLMLALIGANFFLPYILGFNYCYFHFYFNYFTLFYYSLFGSLIFTLNIYLFLYMSLIPLMVLLSALTRFSAFSLVWPLLLRQHHLENCNGIRD